MKTEQKADPRDALRELEERIRDGDDTVSAAALAKARQAAELADLHDQAAERRREREERERIEAERANVRAGMAEASKALADLGEEYTKLVGTIRKFLGDVDAWTAQRTKVLSRAQAVEIAGDVTNALPEVHRRDWITLAAKEARGHYREAIGGLGPPGVLHHPLRTQKERERLDREHAEREAARAAERQAQNAELKRQAEEQERQRPRPVGEAQGV